MIEMKHVCAGYREKEILHDVTLSLLPGKITVLLGPNGCGKSTLLRSLIRLNPHTCGEIFVDGQSIDTFSQVELARKIAYISQSRKIPDISVRRMVLHGRFAYLKYPRRYRKEDYEMTDKVMRWMGIEHLADKNMSELSGGTQQKVYIAMALAQDTPVILMDEPTTFLDISHQMKVMRIAKELSVQGKSVVMVLHDLSQAFETADQLILLSEGKIVAKGSPEDVYQSRAADVVFQIQLTRIKTQKGWKYFCE